MNGYFNKIEPLSIKSNFIAEREEKKDENFIEMNTQMGTININDSSKRWDGNEDDEICV